MQINLPKKVKYGIPAGLAGGVLIGVVGSKLIRGHVCGLCVAVAAIVGAAAGYFIVHNDSSTATTKK